jgi:hypothetical protein
MAVSLSKDHVAMLRGTLFQFLLEITAPMLIFAERSDFSLKVLKTSPSEAVD